MNYHSILKLQKEHGYKETQDLINSGSAWTLEGSVGRNAMDALKSGACMLPKVAHRNAYGGQVPSRDMVKAGTTGSYQNSKRFWENYDEFNDY